MALGCTRLERLLTSSTSTLSLACRRRASSSAVLAQTKGTGQSQCVPVLPPRRPKVQEYLQYVAENSSLTLADLESFRPESHSPVGSTRYEAEYQALMDKLDRSFTVSQLRQFLHLYGVHVSSKIRKHTAATTIVEKQWGWPSLIKSQKLAKAKKERSSRVFPLNPQQAFLLLGKDGAEILSLSQTYNVRLQFSRKPLSLTILGTTVSVEQLERHVETLKQEIVWQDFDPPCAIDISSSSLQQLSRASGCFLESLADGKIRIWFRESSKDSPARAKKLIVQHSIEGVKVPLATSPVQNGHLPSGCLATYAFYPFFCESLNVSPKNRGCFRLRRVGNWFGDEDGVVSHTSEGTTRGYIAMGGGHGDAREQLLSQVTSIPGSTDRRFSVIATPGHVVVNSQGSHSFALVPPLEGQQTFDKVLNWVQENSPSTEFIAGAPMRLWQAPDSTREWKHRLVYETMPNSMEQSQILICEYTPENSLRCAPAEAEADSTEPKETPKPVLRGGPVGRLDVLMPDDAKDIRLTLISNSVIPEASWPTELLKYVKNVTVSSVPDEVPLMFEYESKKYILREDFYIQSNALPVKDELVPVSAVSERRFNSQNGESFLSYEIKCADISSNDLWKTLWTKCEDIAQDRSAPLSNEVLHLQR